MRHLWKTGFLTIVLGLAACGSSAAPGAGGSTAPALGANQATAALASKLGIPPALVEKALETAKAALGSGGAAGTVDKASAAQAGVDVAQAQAESEGKPLAPEQKSGLLEGLKNLL